MLIINMKSNSILKCSLTIIVIIPLLSQCISTASCGDWIYHNVFFYSHALSNDITINNQSLQVTCFKKDVHLFIFYQGFLPSWVKIKVWNNTGLISDDRELFCSIDAKNFTGILIRRPSILGNVWYLIGYCSIFWEHIGYN